ncbi:MULTISPECIES: PadR family transcriptional regulator [Clostridia]|uniref:PadR family transcriptional regulator n=1 Tax=Clostridia TaxID=186801 RepID=UPI000EA32811|nr:MULTISPECIES: PadR family transcriptional regulator [Clostridia]NBJ71228.1 PadR family transcriptional regulator [Roseburia sp. 1XD42-34]RKI74971.1 PadR family transcriptional regulator [Clostridium sp. 1xD42-85]
MSLRSQMLKGILEGCILSIIHHQPAYGYEISVILQEYGLENISEGSIYPILLRLQREHLIIGEMRKSESGPKRKYYQLTEDGHEALREFFLQWEAIKNPVDNIVHQGGYDV